MNKDFWIKKWQEGDIGFHQSNYHPKLEKYGNLFSSGTVLVPLCGKSLDMLYFISKGFSVIGVELSSIACRNFFNESGIQFTEKTTKDFVHFESEKISLWCGDFFKLPQKVWDKVSGIYDRAALIALPEEMRQKYVREITERSAKQLDILLITLEYPEGSMQGPPFSLTNQEVNDLYGQFKIQKLHSEKESKLSRNNPKFQPIDLIENVYWLSKL